MRGFVILVALVGYSAAVKISAYLKSKKVDVDKLTKHDFEELLQDPRFRKYMR